MTIRKTSKPCIGGATPKRDQADWATDDRSVESLSDRTKSRISGGKCARCVRRIARTHADAIVSSASTVSSSASTSSPSS